MIHPGSSIYQLSSDYELVGLSMATEFFRVHGIWERKNIIINKLRSRKFNYVLHRYINSNNFPKKENDFKVLWPTVLWSIKHCNTVKRPNNMANTVYAIDSFICVSVQVKLE